MTLASTLPCHASALLRSKSTPSTPGSLSTNGVLTEGLDYDRLKQVL